MRQRLLFVGLRRISERRIERELGKGMKGGGRYHEDTRELTGPTWFSERDHVASNSIVKWPQDRNDVG